MLDFTYSVTLHYTMIVSFSHKHLKTLYETGSAKGLPPAQVSKIERILSAIDTAEDPEEIGLFPGWRLHQLSGDYSGFWSVTVTGNWRIIFRFEKGNASDVDYLDYH